MDLTSGAIGQGSKLSGRFCLLSIAAWALGWFPSVAASQEVRPYQAYGVVYRSAAEAASTGQTFDLGPAHIEKIDPDVFFAEMSAKGFDVPDHAPTKLSDDEFPTPAQLKLERREQVRAHAETLSDGEYMEVIVELEDIPFEEIRELRSMQTDTRLQVLEGRETLIRAVQLDFADHARGHGALVLESHWLLNRLRVMLPPRAASKVLEHPDVRDVYPAWARATTDWDGLEIREQTFLKPEFYDRGFNFRGETGGRDYQSTLGGDNIKIAIIEGQLRSETGVVIRENFINDTHVGWEDWPGGSSRLLWNVDCLAQGCPTVPAGVHSRAGHSTIVAWIAAGGIDEGQDPKCACADPDDPVTCDGVDDCNDADKQRRTGVAPEAVIFRIRAGSAGEISNALFLAALGGADVVNLSIGFDPFLPGNECLGGGHCRFYADCGGMNDMIKAVTDMGVLVVTSAGNANDETGQGYPEDVDCNVLYPGTRPEVLTVGAIGEIPSSLPYGVTPIGDYSSRGFLTTFIGGSAFTVASLPVVSMTAPGVVELYFAEGTNRYSNTSRDFLWDDPLQGTSFAAPVISGAAGLFRERMGAAVDDARMLKALILLMGDGTEAKYAPPGRAEGVSEVYGTGKFKAHDPYSLQWPAELLLAQDTIEEGESMSRRLPLDGSALPPGATHLKWVTVIDHPDLATAPFVFVHMIDPCNGNIGLGFDWNFALVKYISVEASLLPPGACPELRAWGYSVPPGGVDVYLAAYYHGGDPADH